MKLEKFTKNKKQKRIVIGSIVGIMLLIGGFTLYKTFALYKEEQSFDVLQGTIPYFVYGDVKLAIKVDGQPQTNIPDKKEDYVVEPKCDNDATIEWDYENWGPIIKGISKETRCSLNFVKNNNIGTLGELAEIDNLDSIDTLLTNGNIDKLVNSKSGMTYLAKSPDLVKQIQDNASKYTEDIKKQILDSTAISEDLKYEAGLPCYLLKDNQVLKAAGDVIFYEGYAGLRNEVAIANWIRTSLRLAAINSKSKVFVGTMYEIDTKDYNTIKLNYSHRTDDSNNNLKGIVHFGMCQIPQTWADYKNVIKNLNGTDTFSNYSTSNSETQISEIETNVEKKDNMIFLLALEHDGALIGNSVVIFLNTIALY